MKLRVCGDGKIVQLVEKFAIVDEARENTKMTCFTTEVTDWAGIVAEMSSEFKRGGGGVCVCVCV